jgi:hypothetical protein
VVTPSPPVFGSEASSDPQTTNAVPPDASAGDLGSEALTELGEAIMTLSEELHAQTHKLLLLIAEFDRLEGWKLHGFSSCADWLAFATKLDKVTAREKVRVARALSGLPATSAAMSRGELSFSQVRAITRVADEESELELLAHARRTSAAGLERLVRSWRRLGREDEAALERRRHESRCLSVFPDDEGMYLVRGRLDPEVGALLMRAIEAASDALYRGSVPETTPEQRRADAIGLLAQCALSVGFGRDVSAESCGPEGSDDGVRDAESTDASTESCGPENHDVSAESPGERHTPCCAARADRYLVVLHVDSDTLTDGAEPGRSELEDGTRVSAESSRRIACDASLIRVTHSRNGEEIQVEGRTRTIPLRLRRALEIRDRGCRFPGCGSRFTDAHHIEHWADGGRTRLDNLVLLCKTHHRLLHEGGFRLSLEPQRAGKPTFLTPTGIPIPETPPRVTLNGRQLDGDGALAAYLKLMETIG